MLLKRLFFLALSWCILLQVNAQFSDDFTDGNFTLNPSWMGMDTNFTVDASARLQLDAPATTAESFLYTSSTAIDNAEWRFDVELDFNPSGSNRAYIYLVSDQADLSQSLNGYYVLIGNSNDEISLYQQTGTSSTKIIDGIDDMVDLSSPSVRVRVTRSVAGTWQLYADTSASFNTEVLQGTANDATHLSSNYFGVLCDYTSTRSDKFFFDNFEVTTIPDTVGPILDSVNVISPNTLELSFNEPLNVSSASQIANYIVNNGVGSPFNATYDGLNNSVTLEFTNNLSPSTNYIIQVQGISDSIGNMMSPTSAPFVTPFTLNYRDIVINEILADPTPIVGLPESEFVELYNNTNQSIPLGNITFSDASSTVVLPSIVLPPNEYIILCRRSDSAQFAPFGLVAALSSLPTLNNSGDDLVIAINGIVVDEVSYNSSWYNTDFKRDGGWSLEQVNVQAPCSGAANWIESEDVSGGTPGRENSVYNIAPDLTAPKVLTVSQLSSNQVEVFVDEPLDTLTTATINLSVTPSVGSSIISYSSISSFIVTFSFPFELGVAYDFEINSLTDCAGNQQTEAFTITIGNGISPKPFDLMINEIYAIPGEGALQEEFVELFNTTDSVISLDNLYFADASSSVSLPALTVAPNGYVVLIGGTSTGVDPKFENGTWFIPYSSFPSLNNSGDDLELGNALNGVVIDQVSYSNSWYKDSDKASGGFSLERKNPFDACAGSSNWQEPVQVENTQGAENSRFIPETPATIKWVSAQWASDTSILIEASGKVTASSLSASTSPAIKIDSIVATDKAQSSFYIYFSGLINQSLEYMLTLSSGLDCKGDFISSKTFLLKAPTLGDVVINEVLFNPVTGGSDYVELYNPTEDTINLKGWGFHYLNSDGELRIATLSDSSLFIGPSEYGLFTESIEQTLLQYQEGVETQMHEIDLPSFSNDAGRVTLASNLGDTIDDFSYSEDYHFDLLRDEDGVSLERLDPNRKTNDPTNWHSASELVNYGTPGYENSQFAAALFEDRITISPETFSPDEDGFEDVVTISFSLAQPGYIANVTIYDPNGTKIRELVNNRLLGSKDAISWDGIRDDGQKADIGIYLIYIELFDLSGGTKHYKETCVLATRF